jgi:hypothetical protein
MEPMLLGGTSVSERAGELGGSSFLRDTQGFQSQGFRKRRSGRVSTFCWGSLRSCYEQVQRGILDIFFVVCGEV